MGGAAVQGCLVDWPEGVAPRGVVVVGFDVVFVEGVAERQGVLGDDVDGECDGVGDGDVTGVGDGAGDWAGRPRRPHRSPNTGAGAAPSKLDSYAPDCGECADPRSMEVMTGRTLRRLSVRIPRERRANASAPA
ncbi:hypothetical protein BX265_0887 [Streptomyces sp. TLI_235]|nr:hypothetical protein BX265_0887 [Streptomyces sp. TLI_235]